ncbi:hypothetical protein [Methylotenera sp.]|uniref:hypothetical protein n=1 Tax=Methylotenera sp. TaxID=2051956 RepID=UPI0027361F42|nr:hypothetical protein [Methylotenera sp.]MDP3212084.1 hypothetical protein [Methylotenera sp.]
MMFANPKKLVLCATANQLLVGVWHAGKLQGNQTFENDEAGHQAFSAFLQQYSSSPVYLIADAVEEDFRLESLPHTSGSAKHEMVTRKLNQHYRGLDYRTAHFIDRDKDKRKDDNFLFVAISKDEFLQAWVAIIKAQEAQLVGVYLLPMLSLVLMKQLKLTAPHLLFCEKLSSGLRQTYFHHGCLRMSRLVPNVPEATGKIGYFYLVEIEKTRLYLMSQRYISRDTPLNLALVSVNGTTQQISQGISQEQGLNCADVSLSSLAKTLGLPVKLLQEKPELMHMQLLANGHFVDNLAPDWLTKSFQFNKLKQGLMIGAALIGFFGLAAAGWMFKEGLDQKAAFEQAQQDTLIQQHQYDEAAKDFPVTQISANDLKVAVELDKNIASFPKSPRRMMQVLSAALAPTAKGSLDEVQIDRLHWVLTNDTNINDQDKFTPLPTASNSELAVANSAPPADPTKLMEVAFLTAQISGFTGDYRRALNSLNQFVANIKADTRVAEVVVLQEPVNVSSFVSLQGSTTDEQSAQKQPAFFKLKIVLKPAQDEMVSATEAQPS